MHLQSLLTSLFLSAGLLVQAGSSNILHLKVDDLVQDRFDAHIWIHHRDGAFHHGYVTLPERDNLVHRIDLTPTPPVLFLDQEGKDITPPKNMRGNYSYKSDVFHKFKGQYEKGELTIAPQPLEPFDLKGDTLHGVLDVLIHEIDGANSAGRNNHDLVYRLDIKNLTLTKPGSITVWQYPEREDAKGEGSPRMSKTASAAWKENPWTAAADSGFAPGTEWPSAHGPGFTSSAVPYDGDLVNTLHDAELVWVAEDILPSGRSGGMTRGGFAMFPFEWTTIGYGGYGAPIVADDKVFVFVQTSDTSKYVDTPGFAKNPYVRLGIDPRSLAGTFQAYRDSVYCFDARTGQKIWDFHGAPGSLSRISKSGMASTPVFHDGNLYVRGRSGMYAFEADSGNLIWQKGGAEGVGYGIHAAPHEGSVTVVEDTLILVNREFRERPGHTAGVNPENGELLWKLEAFGGSGIGLPGVYHAEERTLLVLPRNLIKKSKRTEGSQDGIAFVDPKTGEIAAESSILAATSGQLMVAGDMLMGNGVFGLAEEPKKSKKKPLLGGARIGTGLSLENAWVHPAAELVHARTLGVLHDNVYYAFSRAGAFALDITSGETLAKKRHIYTYTGGSHNWTWHVATNDRILTSGLTMMSTADKGMEFFPGRLSLDITSGYSAPTKPAISDGRIFLRLADKLVCYDLRKKEAHADTDLIELVCEKAFPGIQEGSSSDAVIRVRVRNDDIIGVMASWPGVAGPERWKVASWLGEDGHVQWRRSHGEGFTLSPDGLTGNSMVRISYMEEPWELNLTRNGNAFTGTYTRHFEALREPVNAKGGVMGGTFIHGETDKVWNMYVTGAMSNQLQNGKADGNISIVVVTDPEDNILRAWALGGRINGVAHEVDAGKLTVSGNELKGEVTLLFRDDRYITLNPDAAAEQFRKSAHASGVAATYTLSVKENAEGKLNGSHTGVIGHDWKISGTVSGELRAEEEVLGLTK